MIKFVYFDVGGVVIQDFSGTNQMSDLEQLWHINDGEWGIIESDLCIGKINPDKIPGSGNYDEMISEFVTRFKTNPSIWPVISEVKQNYKIGLLTNMYPKMLPAINNRGLLPPVKWDVVIDSSLEKIKKPDSEIFLLAESRCGYSGPEILFIENSRLHTEAASKFGWQTLLYDPTNMQSSNQKVMKFLSLP